MSRVLEEKICGVNFSFFHSSFSKWVAPLGGYSKKRAVIECLFLERESAANIYRILVNVYGKAILDESTVMRLISRANGNPIEKGITDFSEMPCNGKPVADVN